ncbi:MAG: PspA/IM30 family protein [Verrucomicrobiales bacterium]|jgi:phage shock protein A|nr:PspA/IM30 family protein [bacterium]MDF2375718.1 PspA/IM30 family protein [Verrucomicrobiales bacterium]
MFKRIGNLIRGFFGLFVSDLERRNPEALLDVEKENLRKQISEYNKGLAAHAGLCERLISQVERETKEIRELTAKAGAHLKAGNRKLAGEYALRLQKLKEDHAGNVDQLEDAEKTYEELKRARDIAVTAAREKIESLKRGIDETRIAKATAELNEMAAGMINEIGGAGDTLNRLEEIVREEREEAKGRARVAKDSIDTSDLTMMEAERSALEELALADFAAESGIVLESESEAGDGTPATEDEKTM